MNLSFRNQCIFAMAFTSLLLSACGGSSGSGGEAATGTATDTASSVALSSEQALVGDSATCTQTLSTATGCARSIQEPIADYSSYSVNVDNSPVSAASNGSVVWPTNIEVPVTGNTYLAKPSSEYAQLLQTDGLRNWNQNSSDLVAYVRVPSAGVFALAMDTKITKGTATIKVEINNESRDVVVSSTSNSTQTVGEFSIEKPGYVAIKLKKSTSTDGVYPDIDKFRIGGSATIPAAGADASLGLDSNYFVTKDFYWGQRGPSTHWTYLMPPVNVEWAYNEVTVPVGSDPIGTYYMVNGFAEGYGGLQVNSAQERRILFSVWSPFSTDDPKAIPEDKKIKVIAKGPNVYSGEFGNEGSGGQTYLRYPWVAGKTYKFLTQVKPNVESGATDYSMYFYDPDSAKWNFVSTLRRPATNKWLTGFSSFLENFNPAYGADNRKVIYSNQWVKASTGAWFPITRATFSTDPTGGSRQRLDYFGAIENGGFMLSIDGFFNTFTKPYSIFSLPTAAATSAPQSELAKLPALAKPGGTCPAWSAATAYLGSAVVSYNGANWTAKWWTRNEAPGGNASAPWTLTNNATCK